MKKLLVILLVIAAGCSDNSTTNQPQDPVTVAVEEERDYTGIKSYKRGDDLVADIYEEQVSNSPAMKKLEDEISNAVRYYDSVEKFNEYDGVNRRYFASANTHKERIEDSILRKRIESLIKTYSDKYASMIGEHNALVKDLDTNNKKISDLHIALKIVQTLPEMHRHQQKNLPSTKPMEQAVQKQRNVINKLDGAVKKNGG